MDPLSVAASVAGLIALTGKTASLTRSLFQPLKRRPQLLKRLADELHILQGILVDLGRRIADQPGEASEVSALQSVLATCDTTMRGLQSQLSVLRDLFQRNLLGRLCSRSKLVEAIEALSDLREDLVALKLTLVIALQVRILKTCESRDTTDVARGAQAAISELALLSQQVDQLRPIQRYIQTAAIKNCGGSLSMPHGLAGGCPGSVSSTATTVVDLSSHDRDLAPVERFDGFEHWLDSFASSELSPTSLDAPVTATGTNPGAEVVDKSRSVRLRVRNLKPGDDKTEVVELGMTDLFHSAVEELQNRGYKKLCGFRIGAQTLRAFVRSEDPVPVYVTSGPSSHSLDWLEINEHEELEDFYDDAIRTDEERKPLQASLEDNGLKIWFHGISITVRINQTILLPDDGETYHLPPLSGPFPLLDVRSLEDTLPEPMLKKGGIVMPVYDREAISISFITEPAQPGKDVDLIAAVRVAVGGINAVSLQPHHESSSGAAQDYVILPHQKRLDGFLSDSEGYRGVVQQFVASPVGAGYSAEAQITGEEYINGIQFVVAPPLARGKWYSAVEPCHAPVDEQGGSPSSLGFNVGDVLWMAGKEIKARYSKECSTAILHDGLRPRATHEVLQSVMHLLDDPSEPLNVEAVLEMTIIINIPEDGTSFPISASPFMPVEMFYDLVKQEIKPPYGLLLRRPCGKTLAREYAILHDVCFDGIHLTCFKPSFPLMEWGGESTHPTPQPIRSDRAVSKWEMATGLGGKVYQEIYADTDRVTNPGKWKWNKARLFNVQMLNAVAWAAHAGGPAPEPPISFGAFVGAGMPLYHLLPSGRALERSDEREVLGVSDLMPERVVEGGVGVKGLRPIGCTACLRMLADTILTPCNHIFCQECISNKMQDTDGVVCLACKAKSARQIRFAGPMQVPQSGEMAKK